jgi:2-iminobutanoate/2-iminopropanoate deaminase
VSPGGIRKLTTHRERPLWTDIAMPRRFAFGRTDRIIRMQLVPHSPTDGIYPPSGDYAHAMEVRGAERLLFVAGTMGLDPAGAPGATLAEQLELVWSNLRAILASAGMTVDNIVRLTSYLRDASYAEANAAARVAALGGRVVPTTAIVAQTLVSDWMVEIEVVAAA